VAAGVGFQIAAHGGRTRSAGADSSAHQRLVEGLGGAASQQLGMFAAQNAPVRSRHVGSQRIRPGLDPVRAGICLVIAADEACSGVGLARREEGAEGPSPSHS